MSTTTGKVSQIIGPVIDVEFNTENTELPKIYDSLEIKKADGSILVLEVQQHIGEDTVRTISIHRSAPKFEELSVSTEVLFTGIKVIDLIEPYAKGGKIGLFGGAGVGKTVLIQELIKYMGKK